jgi:hypothetical protein
MPGPLLPARHLPAGGTETRFNYLLFLLPLDFFSPPWLLRLLLPLARSLCALLFCELALPPLLAASARLPLLRLDDDDDLEL